MATKNDASLGLRLAQVEGKGRGVLVACLIFHALVVFLLSPVLSPSDHETICGGGTGGGVQGDVAHLQGRKSEFLRDICSGPFN